MLRLYCIRTRESRPLASAWPDHHGGGGALVPTLYPGPSVPLPSSSSAASSGVFRLPTAPPPPLPPLPGGKYVGADIAAPGESANMPATPATSFAVSPLRPAAAAAAVASAAATACAAAGSAAGRGGYHCAAAPAAAVGCM